MAFYQKLATGTLYQVISRIASPGASFLITILVARHFGVSSYGDFAKVTAFVTLFYLFSDFGFNAIFLQRTDAPERFRDLFYTRIVLSMFLLVIVNGIALLLPYNSYTEVGFSPFVREAIALFSVTIVTESIVYSAFAVFQRKYMYERFMVATIIGSFMTVTAAGVCILLGFSLLWIFIAFVLGGLVEASLSLLFTQEKLFPIVLHKAFITKLFIETVPVALMLIFNLIYFNIDTFILSLFRPSSDIGIYTIAYSVFNFLIALPLFLSNVLYPKLIENEKNKRISNSNRNKYIVSFLGMGIIVAIPFWFFASLIFSLINPQLSPAVLPLRFLLLSLPIFFATSILQWMLLAKKQQIFLSILYLALAVINIILNLLLIPHYGYVASAIITSVCEALVLIVLWIRIQQIS